MDVITLEENQKPISTNDFTSNVMLSKNGTTIINKVMGRTYRF